jgi:hypothetical protein
MKFLTERSLFTSLLGAKAISAPVICKTKMPSAAKIQNIMNELKPGAKIAFKDGSDRT